jgi:hypothetical protein
MIFKVDSFIPYSYEYYRTSTYAFDYDWDDRIAHERKKLLKQLKEVGIVKRHITKGNLNRYYNTTPPQLRYRLLRASGLITDLIERMNIYKKRQVTVEAYRERTQPIGTS